LIFRILQQFSAVAKHSKPSKLAAFISSAQDKLLKENPGLRHWQNQISPAPQIQTPFLRRITPVQQH
jgi:hypothetical protein